MWRFQTLPWHFYTQRGSLRCLSHTSPSLHAWLVPVAERTARMSELSRALTAPPGRSGKCWEQREVDKFGNFFLNTFLMSCLFNFCGLTSSTLGLRLPLHFHFPLSTVSHASCASKSVRAEPHPSKYQISSNRISFFKFLHVLLSIAWLFSGMVVGGGAALQQNEDLAVEGDAWWVVGAWWDWSKDIERI